MSKIPTKKRGVFMKIKFYGWIVGTFIIVLIIIILVIILSKMNPPEVYNQICNDKGAKYVFIECYNSVFSYCDMDKVGDLCEYPNGTQFKIKLPTNLIS